MAITTCAEMIAALQGDRSCFCPVCRSDLLVLDRLDKMSPLHVEQRAGCTSCGATWTMKFTLSEINELVSDDTRLSPAHLREKYDGTLGPSDWGEHPDHPMREWQGQVAMNDTRLGYWEWVQHRLQDDATDG